MTEQPITVRCTCCDRVDTADITAADYDTLAAALGQDTPATEED